MVLNTKPDPSPFVVPSPPVSRYASFFLTVAAFLAAALLYVRPLSCAVLSQDDFQILAQSWTWPKTAAGLWAPNNEHVMPLGRLLTFAVVQLAGRPTALPLAGVLTGVVGLFLTMALAGLFVRREMGHPFYGLTAGILFGVSAVYQQAVYWFAACFSVFALAFLLLALLATQRYRTTGEWRWLLACIALCALAPCWFATGILAGPFCCLYLLPRKDDGGRGKDEATTASRRFSSFLLPPSFFLKLTPLLGTAAFLAVVLPMTLPTIQHLEHYDANHTTALEAFQPLTGAWNTVRSLVDNFALGAVGVSGVTVGSLLAPPILALLAAAFFWWLRRSASPQRRLILLGVDAILGSYLLIYSGRAAWGYDGYAPQGSPWQLAPAVADPSRIPMYTPTWSRYHLQPQFGLVLLICAGLSARADRWFRLRSDGRLTKGQTTALASLLGLCLLIQAPRGFACYYAANPRQKSTLSLIERASDFCREHHIATSAARRELGRLHMPESTTIIDGWEFLRGSDDPKDWSQEEVRNLLETAR